MVRSRVLSFISTFGGPRNEAGNRKSSNSVTPVQTPPEFDSSPDTPSPPPDFSPVGPSGSPRAGGHGSRPASMVFSHNPPQMRQGGDTPAELLPIFSFINTHMNKVYHEGYFLKLNDLDSNGRPCTDRQWVECYAQLVGTVLSLWHAAALDAAGGEEVPPTFINLADASIKMLETLPIRNGAVQPLKNVLSVCSAAKNRYLLHFNSFHSLTQWTAAIRLAMFEHTSLYEAYTGSLIAAKGKNLNGIKAILEPCRFKHEDWARVRFGAGTPWRRCWCVVTPPDEKEVQRARKAMKKSAYDRLSIPITGNIKFYETKKTKKVTPIATVTNVYSAYAIYPQSQALIDQSTLVKLEGQITIHTQPQPSTEGMVFVMPEVHPAVSGFEMMLRFLFPTFDVFNLYGRPTRLVADTNHIKSIMFAFPQERRYGYLDVLDIASLLQAPGSQNWSEAEWRKQLKEATQKRLSAGRSRSSSINSSKPRYRSSLPAQNTTSTDSPRHQVGAPTSKPEFNLSAEAIIHPKKNPPPLVHHSRGFSDTPGFQPGPKLGHVSMTENSPHSSNQDLVPRDRAAVTTIAESSTSEDERQHADNVPAQALAEQLPSHAPPAPVANPPAFSHGPRDMPSKRPRPPSEMRLANNRMSNATLSQLAAAREVGSGGAGVTWEDELPYPNNDQPSQYRTPGNAFSSQAVVPVNRSPPLAHSSSDEGMGPALPVLPPKVPEHRTDTASTSSTPSLRHLQPGNTQVVKRKPLPQRQLFREAPAEPSLEDLRHTLDEDAMNRVAPRPPSPRPLSNDEESVYDDAESTTTPDYASTHESVYSKRSVNSVPRPRMGVMKTVGSEPSRKDVVIGDAHYSMDQPARSDPDIPRVNFGPTLAYAPTTGRPSTADRETLRRPVPTRNDSDGTEKYRLNVPTQPMGRAASHEDFRRSVMWQPGMANGRPVSGGGLSAEQYVQQRAAPSPPRYAHHSTSSNAPQPQRPVPVDWARSGTDMNGHRDANYRPSSRGTNYMPSYNDVSHHLSAREQEHVARMTGSSFFNMSSDNQRPQAQVNPMGLVSAIDAREREKRVMKEGMSNQMVQHAIARCHQQMMQQQQNHAPSYGNSFRPPQSQENFYNLPEASRTWDALQPVGRADEPRRQSWYGQLPSQPQPPPTYHQSQTYTAYPGYYNNANTMH